MSTSPMPTLLLEAARSLNGAAVRPAGAGHEVVVAGTVVAIIGSAALEVRLRPAVARAALKTPGTARADRGGGWVRYSPAELDGFARDRALAWLESAVRLGTEGVGEGR